ncbi:hypothetical protein [Uliginosibacterium gangwonense]|uniref:hypothetical protein n=1 Tax=Uliginosibacterium gangwonense TaxID=392736 RepID=UPI000379695D|nr:hypothetical protein [Uliginosibacterium gangwonense]
MPATPSNLPLAGTCTDVATRCSLYGFLRMDYPEWSGHLINLYWNVRNARFARQKRKAYRRVRVEKLRLVEAGIDPEKIRLISLVLCQPNNQKRWDRYFAYAATVDPQLAFDF